MGSLALTAPDCWGFLSGSTFYCGAVNGYNNSALGSGVGLKQLNVYGGTTLATPIKELRVGAAFDWVDFDSTATLTGPALAAPATAAVEAQAWTLAGYASFQATEKLSFHVRGEYIEARLFSPTVGAGVPDHSAILAATGTVQYDLWKNVVTRAEFRWDRSVAGPRLFGGSGAFPDDHNAYMLAANIIYKF